jgi:citrate lyase synthetase
MKKNYVIGGIIMLVLLLAFTNPSEQEHKNSVMKTLTKSVESTSTSNKWEQLGQNLGIMIVERFVDNAVKRNNFILFSFTKATYQGETKNIGFGILGKVYLSDKISMN